MHLAHTHLSESVLERIKRAVTDQDGKPNFGHLSLRKATIDGRIDLRYCRFTTAVEFYGMKVSSYLDLEGARLEKGIDGSFIEAPLGVDFYRAEIGGGLNLEGSKIGSRVRVARCTINGSFLLRDCEVSGEVECYEISVSGPAYLSNMKVEGDITFRDSSFSNSTQFYYTKTSDGYFNVSDSKFSELVEFEGVSVARDLIWERAVFQEHVTFDKAELSGLIEGTAFFREGIDFSRSSFRSPVTMQACARSIDFSGARFEAGATLLFRYATVRMTGATLAGPTSLVAYSRNFRDIFGNVLDEPELELGHSGVKLLDVSSVDTSNLTLIDIDLTLCRFTGAFNLDQLRLDGRWTFSSPPNGYIGLTPFAWAKRKVIEEERQWRALHNHPRPLRKGWGDPPDSERDVSGLATQMSIYRQLRKGREDAKDEPGANDFYYGEMEMRRHGQHWGRAERWLLQAYWLLSGYGLRASRAFGWLIVSMMITVLLMMGFGLPQGSSQQRASGVVPSNGGEVTFEIDKEAPKNPTGDRFTSERFEKALNVTLNSVVFRSSGQDLTTAGTYLEMASRFSEPVLLGLGVLAVRGRLKRGS
ncbi:pentapeptide repeat-containing protein [Streptomyces moderatus]|nr:pentapeptide repeat-containing protein [Streptomyces moderatus]